MIRFILATVFVSVAAANCVAAPVPKTSPESNSYLATDVGAKWTYETKADDITSSATLVVMKSVTKDGCQIVTIGKEEKGDVVPVSRMATSSKGVYKLSSRGTDIDPPFCILLLPVKPGLRWEVKIPLMSDGSSPTATCTIRGDETVEVPAGKFTAVRVDIQSETEGMIEQVSNWYAPKIGLVKSVSTISSLIAKIESVTVLKSFAHAK